VKRRRQNWARRLRWMRKLGHRLVFLDETSVRTGLTRLRGRCPRGQRLYGSTPFGRWHSQTFVAGLTRDELIAPWIIPGAMDGDAFDTYVETQLAPVLAPGTVVILDNLSTHRSPRAAAVLKARGCWLLFLPPYSPDLNPIEMAFAKLKVHLRRLEARSFERVVEALGSICALFTSTECENYFRAAGYAPD
jgi:transposase